MRSIRGINSIEYSLSGNPPSLTNARVHAGRGILDKIVDLYRTAGVRNLRPAGHMRTSRVVYAARGDLEVEK